MGFFFRADRGHSISLPRGFRGRASGDASFVPTSLLQPFLGAEFEFSVEFGARFFTVDEVAKPSSDASLAGVESTASLSKVGDGAEFAVDGARGVPPAVEGVAGGLGAVLVLEAGVDVADQVVVVVVAHDHLLDLAVLAHLAPQVLVEGVKVVLEL